MKRLIVAVLTAGLSFALAPAADAAKVIRVTLQLPITHHLGKNLTDFKNEVERETKGEITVEIYPASQLYKDSEVPQAVSSGGVEMGVASLAVFAGTIPAVDVFEVPFSFPTWDLVTKATAPGSPVRGPLDEAILKTGARVLWWQAYGGTILLSKGKPIVTPADMKDKKVRTFGKTLGEFVKSVGGVPASISGSEQILAYQRGTVDAGMTGVTAVDARKLYQVMDYLTVTNHADVEFVVLINEKTWQSLTDSERAVMTKAARRVEKELRDNMGRLEQASFDHVRDKIKIIELTPEQLADWKKSTASVIDTFIKSSGPLGKQLVEAADKL
ncbi:TRAP transporter substrate-binding protein [Shumkonia mesophila]|uniref:TRAP transporter substrate-binding protein n=1 Tax=Shumkonia mesophila TaxID=2838854 RepID=UPI00293429F5|nr:TRAP transporter substrate-binding protein DctP [Shumkonia mesophila]